MTSAENRGRVLPTLLTALAAAAWLNAAFAAEDPKTGGPYVPTPQVVVDQMLRFANVNEKDFVIDLGSGDGVIVLTAAKKLNASGMGVDIDADLVRLSNNTAQKLGIAERVSFVQLDVFKADLSKASVLTLYLLPAMMVDLRSKIFNELTPGARIVSHDYHFGSQWTPDDQISFDVPEKESVTGVPKATIYLWHVPAKIAGKWEIRTTAGETYELTLKQHYQRIEGSVTAGRKTLQAQQISLRGNELSFALPDGKGDTRFSGRVKGDAMEGTLESPGARPAARWSALRTATGTVDID